MKKFFALILAAISLAGASTGAAASPEKITIAYFQEWPTANQVAQAEKWYDEELGVPLEWRPYNTGVEMAEAMVAGEVDISFSMGVVPFALAVTAGAPIRVVGVAVDTGGADNCVIYKKEAIDRANAHELEGRKVAVPLNTVTHYKMLRSLVFLGVNVDKINVIDMSPHDIDDAFINGGCGA
jgi:taurine transport system substrate-binding protein